MDSSLSGLIGFYERARADGRDLVLATILRTEASTYRKAGTRVLIDVAGANSSLLSGGCLEADLRERAAKVLAGSRPQRVWFDTRMGEDPLWGLGMGCQGAMDVWLEAAGTANGYGPLPFLADCLVRQRRGAYLASVVGGDAKPAELGVHSALPSSPPQALTLALRACTSSQPQLLVLRFDGRELEVFVAPVTLPIRLLLCGGGPDAIPLHAFARRLGWAVSIYDHRPAFAAAEHFPDAERVFLHPAEELAQHTDLRAYDAAVVMSHHLAADIAYLRSLHDHPLRYIGLLGPPARRARVFAEAHLSDEAAARVHGPAGLDIGANTPESIALAIAAQIQSTLSGRSGGNMAADSGGGQVD